MSGSGDGYFQPAPTGMMDGSSGGGAPMMIKPEMMGGSAMQTVQPGMQPVQPSSFAPAPMGGEGMMGEGGGMMDGSAYGAGSGSAAPMGAMPPSAGAGSVGSTPSGGPCVASDSAHPVARLITAFQPLVNMPPESIPAAAFCEASTLILPIYHILFGGEGVVSRTLSSDVSSHIDEIRAAYSNPGAPQQLLPLLQWESIPAASGGGGRNEMELKKGWSATHGLLWVLRAERMVSRLAGLMADPTQSSRSPTDLARQAYTEVLKPYHGFMVASTVKLAFSFVPGRERLQALFGYPTLQQAYDDLGLLFSTMGAVCERLTEWMRMQGKDYPDKA